jgi:hypothetical protein
VEALAGHSGEQYVLELEEGEGRTLRVRMSGAEALLEVLRRLRGGRG